VPFKKPPTYLKKDRPFKILKVDRFPKNFDCFKEFLKRLEDLERAERLKSFKNQMIFDYIRGTRKVIRVMQENHMKKWGQ
jgi:hypothetical protein